MTEDQTEEEEEFYNSEEYTYEYEVGSCCTKLVIQALLEA